MDYDKEAWHTCRECQGRQIVPYRPRHGLSELCPSCKGHGGRDWVDNARDQYPPRNDTLEQNIIYSNIQRLQQMIQDEGQKVGIVLEVTVRPVQHNHNFTYQTMGGHVHSAAGYDHYGTTIGPPISTVIKE